LLFIHLIVQADDQGRLPGDAVDVRALCLPSTIEEVSVAAVSAALDELEGQRCTQRYTVDSESYLQIPNWWKYQSWLRRAYRSQYPPPVGWEDIVKGVEKPTDKFFHSAEQGSSFQPPFAAKRGHSPRNAAPSDPIPKPKAIGRPIADIESSAPTASPLYEGDFPSFGELIRKPNESKDDPPDNRKEDTWLDAAPARAPSTSAATADG
jgi:hypothetical protein